MGGFSVFLKAGGGFQTAGRGFRLLHQNRLNVQAELRDQQGCFSAEELVVVDDRALTESLKRLACFLLAELAVLFLIILPALAPASICVCFLKRQE